MAALNEELLALVETVRPTPGEVEAREAALGAVKGVLLAVWPAARVELFGSCANGLSVAAANDIDVCLVLPPGVADDAPGKSAAVEAAAAALEGAGFTDILSLPRARVPVVKCTAPPALGGTKVDVTVNNMLALLNTRLLATYVALDPRLAQLSHVIKHWAKRRSVNDPYRGTLSSYAYVLMCIHLLQTRSPPILPILQGGPGVPPPTVKTAVGPWKVEYCGDVAALAGFGAANTETLADLVWAFFEYWAWRHDYSGSVISVRLGGWLTKAQKDWTRRQGSERHLLGIEDPFQADHDLGRTVDRATAGVLQKEFERAGGLLREHAGPGGAARLMEPYRAGRTDGG
jgi:DNA polymerase sigma